jgi:hypothetical protein
MKIKKNLDSAMVRDVQDFMVPGTLLVAEPPKWEYKTVVLPDTADLNRFGAEGWELIGVKERPADQAVFYFRRLKQP